MSRELWLLRHGKSAWDSGVPDDFDRPLAKRGQKDAPRVGRWLARLDHVPDQVISSPAARARETVLAVVKALGMSAHTVVWDNRVYEAGVTDLLAVLADVPPAAGTTLLVGHNPGLDDLLVHLAGERASPNAKGKLMTTAAVAALALPDDWHHLPAGCADLLFLKRPKELSL